MTKIDTKEIRKEYGMNGNLIVLNIPFTTNKSVDSIAQLNKLCDAYDEAQKELTQLRNESFKRLSDLLSCKQLLRDTMKRIQKELGEG